MRAAAAVVVILAAATKLTLGQPITMHAPHTVLSVLGNIPLPNPDLVLFTNGSSFIEDGKRCAGYAVMTLFKTLEAELMRPGMAAQAAELRGFTRALQMAKGKRVFLWTLGLLSPHCMFLEPFGNIGEC